MLEGLRAGERAVLGDVADEHDGSPVPFRGVDQAGGGLTNLGHPAGGAGEFAHGDGLDGIDDQEVRSVGL